MPFAPLVNYNFKTITTLFFFDICFFSLLLLLGEA